MTTTDILGRRARSRIDPQGKIRIDTMIMVFADPRYETLVLIVAVVGMAWRRARARMASRCSAMTARRDRLFQTQP
ncbi:hypothetical protein PX699_14780 [Sphingobium sp. H39-3-25]|uniref:hypothetical protein n=1 Tax=Sphingobium arseniciresistens TaxID=3030834 RepID=UPI0023B928F1|nr:hypothetical protein [Sphingobium arseniciresistens]